jgi:enolase
VNTETITGVSGFEALDSRGRPTVAARVTLAGGASARAIAPSGASTGGHEAIELRDGGGRYGGAGARRAVEWVNGELGCGLLDLDADDQTAVDERLEQIDGTSELSRCGANAVLAISLAAMLAHARARRLPLWRSMHSDNRPGPLLPMPMVNIISGGAHAGRLLDIQDVLVVPVGAAGFAEAIEWVARVRAATAALLTAAGGSCALVADEGGLAHRLDSNEAAVALVRDGIQAAGLRPGQEMAIAIDVAANQIWDGESYFLRTENRRLTPGEWIEELAGWRSRYPIVSLEDVLVEDDWPGWRSATRRLGGCQTLGDDLFATSHRRLRQGVEHGAANAVLVKPNQAGTVSRARRTFEAAVAAGYRTVLSARSGDTEEHWLADLAVGWEAGQIKVGSTTRSERTAKWNRLLEIEADAGRTARWAAWPARPATPPCDRNRDSDPRRR